MFGGRVERLTPASPPFRFCAGNARVQLSAGQVTLRLSCTAV
jgi:hypothetical protein